MFASYLVFGLLVSILDLGNTEPFKFYCNLVMSMVPSIHPTALVSSNVSGTCLVLSVAWPLGLLMSCLWLYWALPLQVQQTSPMRDNRSKYLLLSLVTIIFFGSIVVWFFSVPFDLEGVGRGARTIRWALTNGAFTTALIIGLMIISTIWLTAVGLLLGIKALFSDKT